MTGPLSILFVPLVLLDLYKKPGSEEKMWRAITAVVVCAGAMIQFSFVVVSPRLQSIFNPTKALDLEDLIRVIAINVFYKTILGIRGVMKIDRYLTLPVNLLGLLLLLLLVFVAIRDRQRPLLILLYLAVVSTVSGLLFPLADVRHLLMAPLSSRYFLHAAMYVSLSVVYLACDRGWMRWVGRCLLLAVLAIGVPFDFRRPVLPITHFPDQMAVFRTLPAGSSFQIPVVPDRSMVLIKKDARREASPLANLQPLKEMAASRINLPIQTVPSDGGFVKVVGFAVDAGEGTPAGGVYVQVDDKLFPAVYGISRSDVSDHFGNRNYERTGFERAIPISEIGIGLHRISLIVLTHDRKSYYMPSRHVRIDVPAR